MSIFRDKTALVTGSSSGIGFDLAYLLAEEGAKVILTGSNSKKISEANEELEKKFPGKVNSVAKDLSKKSSPLELFEEIQKLSLTIDVLVNNAGVGIYGKFHETPLEKTREMIDVNVLSLVELTRLFLPEMVKRKSGFILNVASTASFQGIPREAIYASTKAFVLTFSEALTEELKEEGVVVTCLCPGPTETPFFSRNDIFPSKMMTRSMMTSRSVAKIGLQALKKKKTLVIAGIRNKVLLAGGKIIPRQWATKIAGEFVK